MEANPPAVVPVQTLGGLERKIEYVVESTIARKEILPALADIILRHYEEKLSRLRSATYVLDLERQAVFELDL